MKKFKGTKRLLLLMLVAVFALSISTAIPVAAATESAAYLIADFEDGTIGNTDGNTYSLVDGPGASQKALKVTNGSTLPAFDFGLRSQTTYGDAVWKYNASMWIRADAAVSSDKVDLIFTLSRATNVNTKLTETVSITPAGLKKGEWVKVSKTFTYDGTTKGNYNIDYSTQPVGTVQVKVGGGIAYTIDDLVIMPDNYTPVQSKTQNPILTKKLNDLSSFPTAPWSVASAASYEFTTAYNGTTVTAFGETETIGKALKLVGNNPPASYYTELRYTGANFKFGTEYTVEFMAKAENTDAVNMTPAVTLYYPSNGDEANIGSYQNFSAYKASPSYTDVATGSLADGWKKFKISVLINKVTQTTVKPSIYFRLYGSSVNAPQWTIANIDMYPTRSEFTNLSSVNSFTGSKLADGTVYADLSTSLMTGQYKAFESRLEMPYGDDYVIYKRYRNSENEDSFIYAGAEIENARLVTNVCDKDNYFSKTMVTPIEMKSSSLVAVAEMDQTIWAADMPNLTATVRYNNATGEETLLALCGMYDENNKMVSYDEKNLDITAGEGEVKLSMETEPTAVKAKVFLWEKDTHAPRFDNVAQITKTTDGKFIYVDAEKGTPNTTYGYNNPLKTVNQAVEAAELLADQKQDMYIILMPGRQPVTSEIEITQAITDASHNLTFVSYDKNDKGIISGATDISGKFTHHENGIWKAPIAVGTESRQLYVNGVRATKARTRDLTPADFTNTSVRSSANVHQLATLGPITTTSAEWQFLADVKRPADLEFVFFAYWTMNRCQVASVSDNGAGTVTFNMDSPAWNSLNTQYNAYARTPAYIENAYEFIDEPGEWYLDSIGGYVYYMPRANENMATAEVMLPTFDNDQQYLVSVIGTDAESVQNVTFDNVVFSHTTWNRPNTAVGHCAAQDNLLSDYYKDASSGRYAQERLRSIESAIEIQNTSNIKFTGCEFSKLGGNGIRIFWNVQDCEIQGCEFYDISSSALQIADYNTEDESKFGKLQYGANVRGITVSDNYIHHTGRDFWSAAAVSIAWARDILFQHNEVAYTPYSGMHIGIGWSGTAAYTAPTDLTIDVKNNYFHDIHCYGYIYDGGAIYTNGLSGGTQDNPNEISGNYIEGVGPDGAAIYNDEGSTYYYVHDNVMDVRDSWSEEEEVLGIVRPEAKAQNINISDNYRPHGLVWKNNYAATRDAYVTTKASLDSSNDIDNCIMIGSSGDWCDEAKAIMANAGIRDEYKNNFRYRLGELSVIEEVELNPGESISAAPAFLTAKNEGYKNNSLTYTARSSDPDVAKVEGGRIVAVADGSAIITYEVVENGVLYTAQTIVTVPIGDDYIADLSAYRMSFENGGSLRMSKDGNYYNVQEATATTNGNETFQIVANPNGGGKVVKLDLVGSLGGNGSSIALTKNTASASTGEASASLPAGATITFTFKYYWAQEMDASNNPAFCIYNSTGSKFATGTDFKTEAGKWHRAVLTYTNDTGAAISLGNAQIRFCGANDPSKTWKAKTITDGTTYGARTVYIDNVTATIK